MSHKKMCTKKDRIKKKKKKKKYNQETPKDDALEQYR